jgi:hypothetical protein
VQFQDFSAASTRNPQTTITTKNQHTQGGGEKRECFTTISSTNRFVLSDHDRRAKKHKGEVKTVGAGDFASAVYTQAARTETTKIDAAKRIIASRLLTVPPVLTSRAARDGVHTRKIPPEKRKAQTKLPFRLAASISDHQRCAPNTCTHTKKKKKLLLPRALALL